MGNMFSSPYSAGGSGGGSGGSMIPSNANLSTPEGVLTYLKEVKNNTNSDRRRAESELTDAEREEKRAEAELTRVIKETASQKNLSIKTRARRRAAKKLKNAQNTVNARDRKLTHVSTMCDHIDQQQNNFSTMVSAGRVAEAMSTVNTIMLNPAVSNIMLTIKAETERAQYVQDRTAVTMSQAGLQIDAGNSLDEDELESDDSLALDSLDELISQYEIVDDDEELRVRHQSLVSASGVSSSSSSSSSSLLYELPPASSAPAPVSAPLVSVPVGPPPTQEDLMKRIKQYRARQLQGIMM